MLRERVCCYHCLLNTDGSPSNLSHVDSISEFRANTSSANEVSVIKNRAFELVYRRRGVFSLKLCWHYSSLNKRHFSERSKTVSAERGIRALMTSNRTILYKTALHHHHHHTERLRFQLPLRVGRFTIKHGQQLSSAAVQTFAISCPFPSKTPLTILR